MSHRHLGLVLASAVVATLAACGDESTDTQDPLCRSSSDCADGTVCIDTRCVAPECESATDCGNGESCIAGECVFLDTDADAGDGSGSDAGDDGGTDAGDTSADVADDTTADISWPDTEEDVDYGPLVWSITPVDGAVGVPLDIVIEVAFNQPMNALRMIPSNLTVTDDDGTIVERAINFDADSFVLGIAPPAAEALLQPATAYTFRMSDLVQAASGEEVGTPVFTEFMTVGWDGMETYEELARAYAPVVYQQVAEPNLDGFTRVDFDGDRDPADNLRSAVGAQPAWVYWGAVESQTHVFLTYMFYYPGTHPNPRVTAEHDVIAAQVIVRKLAEDPLGELRAWSTFYRTTFSTWAASSDFYADDADPIADPTGRLPRSRLTDNRQVELFVESGTHAICLPTADDGGRCRPSSDPTAPFAEDLQGYIWRAGETPQRIGDSSTAEHTYALLSMIDEIWLYRTRTEGDSPYLGGTFNYNAPVDGESPRPGDGAELPTAFPSVHDGGTFGELPFVFSATDDPPGEQGVWMVDPAYRAQRDFTLAEAYSLEYCFNPWLGIDRRGELSGCSTGE